MYTQDVVRKLWNESGRGNIVGGEGWNHDRGAAGLPGFILLLEIPMPISRPRSPRIENFCVSSRLLKRNK